MDEEQKKNRIAEVETVINSLQHNDAFNIVLKDKRRTIELCDSNWHLIDLNDKDKLLELKYAKLGAEAIVNAIEIYKQELQSLTSEETDKGYMDNYD